MYVLIIGCGRVGSQLAKLLANEGHNVVIIDKSPEAFGRLGGAFNGVTSVGNGFDIAVLKEAGIEHADAFCALTNGDNTNLVAAQVAKKVFKVPRVIARIYDPQRADAYKSLGLDVVSGTVLFAGLLRDKIIESRFSGYLIESGDVGVLQINVKGELAGKRVQDINIPGELIVTALIHKGQLSQGKTVIPKLEALVAEGDILMAVAKVERLDAIRERLNLKEE
jgi:trk system potassium uptake protein